MSTQQTTYVSEELETEMFSELCNWFWFHSNSDWPQDGFMHTSSECRKFASEIMALLSIEPFGSAMGLNA